MCLRIRKGSDIYTIGADIEEPKGDNLVSNCASSEPKLNKIK